jgi:hypothetical protein
MPEKKIGLIYEKTMGIWIMLWRGSLCLMFESEEGMISEKIVFI